MNMNPEFINGLTNYAKLHGTINGIDKEIHIFFDKHLNLDEQTKCESFNSVDISYYLYKLIKETKEQLDFFMEIRMLQLEEKNISNKKDIYIQEVVKLFKTEFEKKNNDDMNIQYSTSKSNSNVKLHYFDIRDHLDIFFLTKIVNQKMHKYSHQLNKNITDEKSISKIIFYMEQINDRIKLLVENTKEIILNDNNVTYDKINNKQKYYLNKIVNKYENKFLKKNINIFLGIHDKSILHSIDETIINIKYMLENNFLMNIEKLNKNIDKLGEYILQLYSLYKDTYLLRRILDKNYVKKCIVYSGGSHSVNIIFFLVKYCDFKIIKIHDGKEKDVNLLMKKINNEFYSYNVYELFLQKKVFIQCIHWEPIIIDDTIPKLQKYYKSKNN